MEKAKVYLENCREYDPRTVERVFADGLAFLGVKMPRQSKVLVKPNVLAAHPPERHITTHPVVVDAVVRLLRDNRNEVIIADSSSIPGGTGKALERSGIAAVAKRFDATTVYPFEELPSRTYTNPKNRYLPTVNLSRVLDDVECIVNVPKLKSHSLTRLTCAVKNFLGCIPGGGKQQAHVKAPSGEEFSELLVDLYGFIRPKVRLNVLDGIVGLDGYGPGTTGKRNAAGFVALSADAIALDCACCKVIGVDPQNIWTNRLAIERGLGSPHFQTNQDLAPVRFRLPGWIPFQPFLFRHGAGIQRRRPMVITKNCKQCGACAKVCPVQCIAMESYPRWDYARCIYCYCCHESCPHAAIKLKYAVFHRQR